VVDASALVEYLLRTELGRDITSIIEAPESDLHVPVLCDVEVAGALSQARSLELIDTERAQEALACYVDLPLTRYGHQWLLPRILELSEHLASSDATYVALCERLDATLLTGDRQLTTAVGRLLPLNVIGVGA
jgi:predicted nucleic acid-binding protein